MTAEHPNPLPPVDYVFVDDLDDPRLADFRLNERALANRAEKRDDAGRGRFLSEGDLVAERALAAGCAPDRALVDEARIPIVAHAFAAAGGTVFVGGDAVRRRVTGLGMPHPIVALFHRPPRVSASDLLARCRRIVIVEGVDNPANVGAIVRNAAGLGWDGLLLDHTSADPLARRSLRVAMGTAFTLTHARTTDLVGVLGRTDHDLYALTPHRDAQSVDAAAGRAGGDRRGIMIGSERAGLSDDLLALGTPVRIPMAADVDSLNAAAATAIACYAFA